ncbi:MAG: hypothetical protein H8E27_09540 [Verrucomicrobia subdivision 3 bacterium]|nr:hypothetical protein [Limisphaerales bacterium]
MISLILVLVPANVQSAIGPIGEVFTLGGDLVGHQSNPELDFNSNGGFAVWEHTSKNSNGSKILLQPLNVLMEQNGGPVRVSESTSRDDEAHPQVAMLPNGGAVIVWEAGARKSRDVYIRFVNQNGNPMGGTQVVNSFTRGNQDRPDVAVNQKGEVCVCWESQYQDGAGDGVYARRFNAQGIKVGAEIQMNQTIKWSQFNTAIAALKGDGFMVTWVNEVEQGKQYAMAGNGQYGQAGGGEELHQVSVSFMRSQIMGRGIDGRGNLLGNEFRLDGGQAICANPDVVSTAAGGFAVAWEELNESGLGMGQDIYTRSFTDQGQPLGPRTLHNRFGGGDQVSPALAATADGVLVAWDCGSNTKSGSEIHGRMLKGGAEFRVNTRVINKQNMTAAAGNGNGMLMVAWVDVISPTSFLLKAQRYSTKNPSIDLAAGADVTGGGQGPNKVVLAIKKEGKSPGGVKMEEKKEEAVGNVVVQHESAIAEAVRTTQASARAAQNAVKQASRQSTRNVGNVIKPPSAGAIARPVNAEVVNNGGGQQNINSKPSGGQSVFGMHTVSGGSSMRMSAAGRPTIIQRPTTQNVSAKTGTSAGARHNAAGVSRGAGAPMAGGRPAASMVTTQAARNALLSTARNYSGARRIGSLGSAPSIRNPITTARGATSSVRNRATFNTQSRLSSVPGTRGNFSPGTVVSQGNSQRQLFAFRGSQSGSVATRGTISGPYRATQTTVQSRFNEIRNRANTGSAVAQQMRNIPVPSKVTLQNGRMSLRFDSRPGSRYVVQTSNDRSNWTAVGNPKVGTGRSMSVPFQSNGQRFIRVVPRD